jgi:signal transduction histidine kinase
VTRRLVLSYVGMAIAILVLLEVPLAVLAARHERGLAGAQAEREATGLAVVAAENLEHGRSAELQSLVQRYRVDTGGEVAIVDPSGRVLAYSSADAEADATGEDRDLVADALDGRAVDTFGSDEGQSWAHAAVPIQQGGEPGGAVLFGYQAESVEDRVHQIWMALALFGVGALGLTALLGLLLARSVTRPLGRLEATVVGFAEGDRAIRAPELGPPEVRDLAARFNHMADHLNALLDAQSHFVADASHQLRSPLTALRLRLENLEADSDGWIADEVSAAGQEVQRLSRIVDGLLTLGRAEVQEPQRQAVDVSQVITERVDAWSALAEEKGVDLTHLLDSGDPAVAAMVPGDLDQMLDNLIANAIDAIDVGRHIVVSLERHPGGRLAVHVTDDGPGMPAADRHRAFDRFWQGPGTRGGHSGLGLAIVAQLASRNGARAELRQAVPSGLDAVIELPPTNPSAGAKPMVKTTLRSGKA